MNLDLRNGRLLMNQSVGRVCPSAPHILSRNSKRQAPNSKQVPKFQIQTTQKILFEHSILGILDLFGI